MTRTGLQAVCAALVLLNAPANAATKIDMSVEGGKGSAVVTPINDTFEDVMAAATVADGVAVRSATILDLEAYPVVVDIAAFPAPPIAAATTFTPIAPVPVTVAGAGISGYLPFAPLALIPLFLGGGDGDGGGVGTPPGQPSVPGEVPPPPPIGPVPEPATWMMMLMGFGAIGSALRTSGKASRRSGAYA